jgi:hypothetical protein
MKYTQWTLAGLMLLALTLSACGQDSYVPEPEPAPPTTQPPTTQPPMQPPGPEPTGPSLVIEFNEAYSATQAAWNVFRADQTPEN